MKRLFWHSPRKWNILLFASVIFASFILPVMPPLWQKHAAKLVYAIMLISTILTLEKHSNKLFILFFSTLFLLLISTIFDFTILENFSRALNILFFLVIVILLLRQIATAKNVTSSVILDSIIGYLLLGIIYSIFITVILVYDPYSYSNAQLSNSTINNISFMNMSVPLYYSFVSLATMGYGDIVPLKPYTRSLATFIAISGQFYITVIVALLVGKYSAGQNNKNKIEKIIKRKFNQS